MEGYSGSGCSDRVGNAVWKDIHVMVALTGQCCGGNYVPVVWEGQY